MDTEEIYSSLLAEDKPKDQVTKELDSMFGFEEESEQDQVLNALEDDSYEQELTGEDLEEIEEDDYDIELDPSEEDDLFDFFESDAINYSNSLMKKNIKTGANTQGLNSNLSSFFNTFNSYVGEGLKISSGNDGKHMKGSKHYIGKAFDIGANSSDRKSYLRFKAMLKDPKLLQQAKQEFGIEDIIDEGDHIHVELKQTGGEVEYGQTNYQSPFSYSIPSSNSQYPGINYNRPQDYNLPGGLNNSNNVSGYGAVLQPMQPKAPKFITNPATFSIDNYNINPTSSKLPDYNDTLNGLNTATNVVNGIGGVLKFGQNAKSIIARGLDTGITLAGSILNERRNKRDYIKYLEQQYNENPSDYFNNRNDYGNYNNFV